MNSVTVSFNNIMVQVIEMSQSKKNSSYISANEDATFCDILI